MELTFREECWMTFCMKFMRVILHDNHYSCIMLLYISTIIDCYYCCGISLLFQIE
jgi:hypothetical protein